MRVPPLGPPPAMAPPPTAERTLDTALRVIAVRRPGAPLLEVRLRMPFGSDAAGHVARCRLLAETMFAGTAEADRMALAERLQELGTSVARTTDPDMVLLSAAVHTDQLGELLAVLAQVLTGATYPDDEVAAERERLLQKLRMARSQAGVRARETLHRHLFGEHPYAIDLPELADVAEVTAADLRALHAERVAPAGSILVLVGDLDPAAALDEAVARLAGWTRDAPPAEPLSATPPLVADPSVMIHRPGSVQSSIRIGGPALRRDDPKYAALQLTNLLYGGYFSSRLVANIREDKGYTYSPGSFINVYKKSAVWMEIADVTSNVTGASLTEIFKEIDRLRTEPPTEQELDGIKNNLAGVFTVQNSSRGGLIGQMSFVNLHGLGPDYLTSYVKNVMAVSPADVKATAEKYLDPSKISIAIVGDKRSAEKQLGDVKVIKP